MQRARPFLQGAAVASALILGGGFVAYRAGAFDRVVLVETQPESAPASGTDPALPAYLSGSKSSFVFVGDQVKPPADAVWLQPASPSAPTFLGGSKSIVLSGTTTGLTPALPTPDLMPQVLTRLGLAPPVNTPTTLQPPGGKPPADKP
jgi:hypothetical protein